MAESKLLSKDKEIVVPGQAVAEGMDYLPGFGTYRHEERIFVNQLGVLHVDGKVLKLTPLAGTYLPNMGDVIIGKVVDILMSGWRIDINSPYVAMLPLAEASFDFIKKGADLTEYFDLGDYIVCKITQVTSQNLVDISMKSSGLKKLKGGHFVSVNPAKVPRLIGRKGSMVTMLKHATDCQIIVGQNGVVWISGEPDREVLAVRAIRMIDERAHVPGLTDRVKEFLEKETGKEIDMNRLQSTAPERRKPREESFRR